MKTCRVAAAAEGVGRRGDGGLFIPCRWAHDGRREFLPFYPLSLSVLYASGNVSRVFFFSTRSLAGFLSTAPEFMECPSFSFRI